MTNTLTDDILARAKAKLADRTLTAGDLDALVAAAKGGTANATRQRILYLHAASPNIHSPIVNMSLEEPIAGHQAMLDPLAPEPIYKSVHDAVLDGWRVVQFPEQRAPFDDKEIDIVGYEFILEKLEAPRG